MITIPSYGIPSLPQRAQGIQKGSPLADVLNAESIAYLARNIELVWPDFKAKEFAILAIDGLEPLPLMQRAEHIAKALRAFLPADTADSLALLQRSLSEPLPGEAFGLSMLFYLVHNHYLRLYGLSCFDASMRFMHALTQRATAEFGIRVFLAKQPTQTLAVLAGWLNDPSHHVRRLCSEGCRPMLPWGGKLPLLLQAPYPTWPLLEHLKNDPSLYVRRSVANHVADIAKVDLPFVLAQLNGWLPHADKSLRWVIRHSLRHPAKKEHSAALALRAAAK